MMAESWAILDVLAGWPNCGASRYVQRTIDEGGTIAILEAAPGGRAVECGSGLRPERTVLDEDSNRR